MQTPRTCPRATRQTRHSLYLARAVGVAAIAATLLAATAHAMPSAGRWSFEEASGPALDSSGNGNTGTVTGATSSTLAPWVSYTNTRSLLWGAKADQVEIPAGPTTHLHSFPNGVTIEAIIRPETLPIPPDAAGQRLAYILWGDDGAYELLLVSNAAGETTLVGGVNAVGGTPGPCTAQVSTAFVRPFTFTHIAMTYESEVLELYVDGSRVDTGAAAAGCGSAVGPIGFREIVRLGNDETAVGFPNNDRAFRGWIDEVRITSSALDPAAFLRPAPNTVWVSGWSGNCLERYDVPAGTFVSRTPGLADPRGLKIGPDGALYAAIEDLGRIERFSAQTGAFLGVFATGITFPYGLTFGPNDALYATSVDEILRFDGSTGAFIDVFSAEPELDGLRHIVFGPDENLYVAQNVEVLRLDGQTGDFLDVFASPGAPSEFLGAIAFGPDGNLYVGLSRVVGFQSEGRVQRFDGGTGAFIDEFVPESSGGIRLPVDLLFGPEGDLYVSDFRARQVLRYDGTTGAFAGVLATSPNQISGIQLVPEPSSWMLWVAGVAFLAVVRPIASRRG